MAYQKAGKFEEMLGSNPSLALPVQHFGADKVEHLGGSRYVARRADGKELRMLVDKGIRMIEGEEGFEKAWA